MDLFGGTFYSNDAGTSLRKECRKSNALTIEAWITSEGKAGREPKRLIGLSKGTALPDFALAQRRDSLLFGLKTTGDGSAATPITDCRQVNGRETADTIIWQKLSTGWAR